MKSSRKATNHSVNDGILKPPFSVQYVTVDSFIEGIMARGRGTLMANFDVVSTYCNVAVPLQDCPLLGIVWRGNYYVDMALPFSLCSAPYIFSAIADLVQWMLTRNHGVDFLCHYLDDFLTLGSSASLVCYNNLSSCFQESRASPFTQTSWGAPLPACPSLVLSLTTPHYRPGFRQRRERGLLPC